LAKLIEKKTPGQTTHVSLIRKSVSKNLTLILGKRPNTSLSNHIIQDIEGHDFDSFFDKQLLLPDQMKQFFNNEDLESMIEEMQRNIHKQLTPKNKNLPPDKNTRIKCGPGRVEISENGNIIYRGNLQDQETIQKLPKIMRESLKL